MNFPYPSPLKTPVKHKLSKIYQDHHSHTLSSPAVLNTPTPTPKKVPIVIDLTGDDDNEKNYSNSSFVSPNNDLYSPFASSKLMYRHDNRLRNSPINPTDCNNNVILIINNNNNR
ncbi:hypothetical protein PIROE2DRAFT_14788 [Piromyces sp. E2]|nr:hypothetical protein PIROE2DRAFT_14788 [Piromyces sp. E2]|eukprot:OUM59617.1 hypothetical protein PIROE2DRAFT_14788 [Piromyces sp. E2]